MVRTLSTMVELGTRAPDFALPDTDGNIVSRADFDRRPLLVMFICNHCPYVQHLREALATHARGFQDHGVAVVAINSNDADAYPDDSPEAMRAEEERFGYTFPYLFDEKQEVAKAYGAACTPDFFLFDKTHRLVYRGQFDDSRPKSDTPVTGRDLDTAVERMLAGEPQADLQKPSMGCNIKWRPGNEPAYFRSA
ncbi:MAG: thioredoxin family protein [Euryarchaeota archaeon]|nr:thioredoxin family protein [Euryarchaeota archaeon]